MPMLVSALDDALDLSVGAYGVCAWTVGDRLRCWGRKVEGQFGDGTPQGWLTPSPGTDVRGMDAIGSGDRFRMMIVDGELRSFGRNTAGPLGLGVSTASVLEPLPVSRPVDARTIGSSGAGSSACVIVASGALYCCELANNPERSPVLSGGF